MGTLEQEAQKEAKRQIKRNKWVEGIAVLGLLLLGFITYSGWPDSRPDLRPVAGGETRAVLPAEKVPLHAFSAYMSAARYSKVMDQVNAYCDHSDETLTHRSLLSCFTNLHGAECGICQAEAKMVADMMVEGRTVTEIRQAIDLTFGQRSGQ